MIDSSPAARLLLVEAAALERILRSAPAEVFSFPTACDGWSVRDVLAHCAASLGRVASGDRDGFTAPDSQADVELRRGWPLERLLAELFIGYSASASVIAETGGNLDGAALDGWLHGGDIREALGEPDPYTSAGVELALDLLVERSRQLPAVLADLPDRVLHLGAGSGDTGIGDAFGGGSGGSRGGGGSGGGGGPPARVVTDVETLVRLLGGRRPDPARYHLEGITAAELDLYG